MPIKKVSDDTYKKEVLDNPKTTVIKFQADFCGPCHQLTPIVQKISEENPHLYQRDVERLVETIFNEITSALSNGRRAELRGFGAFSVKHRKPRTGRNPRTGISVEVNEKFVPFFKPGKLLRERLNK